MIGYTWKSVFLYIAARAFQMKGNHYLHSVFPCRDIDIDINVDGS